MNQEWEHGYCEVINILDKTALSKALDKWSAEGWELVSTNCNERLDAFYLFWRRPI
jgi:hypothetical protein